MNKVDLTNVRQFVNPLIEDEEEQDNDISLWRRVTDAQGLRNIAPLYEYKSTMTKDISLAENPAMLLTWEQTTTEKSFLPDSYLDLVNEKNESIKILEAKLRQSDFVYAKLLNSLSIGFFLIVILTIVICYLKFS